MILTSRQTIVSAAPIPCNYNGQHRHKILTRGRIFREVKTRERGKFRDLVEAIQITAGRSMKGR
jgi:hypothetical protein